MFASRASLIAESAVVDVCGKSNGGTALRAGEQRVGSSPLLPPRGIPKLGPLGGKGRTVTYLQSPSLSFLVRRVGAVTPPSRIRDIHWGETDRTKRTWAVVAIFLRGSEIPSSPLHLPVRIQLEVVGGFVGTETGGHSSLELRANLPPCLWT